MLHVIWPGEFDNCQKNTIIYTGVTMNAPACSEFTNFTYQMNSNIMPENSMSSMTNQIKKVHVLHYFRATHQTFLNLGSVLISQNDGRLFIFDYKGELVAIDRIKI